MRVRTFVIGAVTGLLVSAGLSAVPVQAATAQPTITSMSAHAGTSAGGQTVTVHGTNLGGTVNAVFGTSEFAKVQVVSSTTVRVRTPRVSRDETHYLVLRTRAGLTPRNAASLFSFVNPPTILVETPGAATRGGTTVTIHGTDLRNVTSVTFGGVEGRLLRDRGDAAIAVLAPKLAAGPHYVVVHTAFGTSNTGRIDYVGPPTIRATGPAFGPASGSTRTFVVIGTNLRDVTSITIGGRAAKFSENGLYRHGRLVTTETYIYQVPAHAPGDATIVVATRYGTATSPTPYRYQSKPALTWHASPLTDRDRSVTRAVSCPTASFCALIYPTQVATFDGSGWSSPKTLDAAGLLYDVSCSTPDFCMAMSGESSSYEFDGTTWTRLDTGANLTRVSCPSAGVCVATGAAGTGIFSAGSWTLLPGSDTHPGGRISCVSVTFCEGVDYRSNAYHFDGTAWTATPVGTEAGTNLLDVACVSDAFCAAADEAGFEWDYTSVGWTRGARVSTSGGLTFYVGCTAVATCEVGLTDGHVVEVKDGVVASTIQVMPESQNINALSCGPDGACVAADGAGRAAALRSGSWGTPVTLLQAEAMPSSVSCASHAFCLATDLIGNVYAYDGASWSGPVRVDPGFAYDHPISCASVDLCATVSGDGVAAVHDAAGWHTTSTGEALGSVSCVSTICVAISKSTSLTYTAGTGRWSATQPIGRDDVRAISCASETDCVALSANGVVHFDGTKWGSFQALNGPSGREYGEFLTSLACSRSFCLAGDGFGTAMRDRSGRWGRVLDDTRYSGGPIDCSADGLCLAATGSTVEEFSDGAWSTRQDLDPTSENAYVDAVTCADRHFCVGVRTDGSVVAGTS